MRSLILIFLLLPQYGFSAESHFLNGLSAFKENNFELSEKEFTQALQENPNNPHVLLNLGLVKEKLGKDGAAIAAWRKTLFIEPTNSSAKEALRYIQQHLPDKEPQQLWEVFRKSFLMYIPLNLLLPFVLLTLILTGLGFIRYFKRRKTSTESNSPLPLFPAKSTLGFALFLVLILLSSLKTYDLLQPRGTVISKEPSLRISPGDQALEITRLKEGHEIIMLKRNKNWVQVHIPDGPTGWIKSTDIFHSYGRRL